MRVPRRDLGIRPSVIFWEKERYNAQRKGCRREARMSERTEDAQNASRAISAEIIPFRAFRDTFVRVSVCLRIPRLLHSTHRNN